MADTVLKGYLGFCAGRTEVNQKKKYPILQPEFHGVSLYLDGGAEVLVTAITIKLVGISTGNC
jgi:hypothetical protein